MPEPIEPQRRAEELLDRAASLPAYSSAATVDALAGIGFALLAIRNELEAARVRAPRVRMPGDAP